MFFLKKSSYKLSEIICNYTDIHSHLLPGIDDGSQSVENSFELIQKMNAIGVNQFITTPHIFEGVWNNSPDTIQQALSKIENGLTLPFRTAAEYMMDSFFYERIKHEWPLLTLMDNLVLVELSYLSPPIQLLDIVFELQLAGYKPLLAHPERYLYFASKKEEEFQKLKKAGCLFQLNLLSTTGYYGKGVVDLCRYLLESDLYDYSGSDVHHLRHIDALQQPVKIKQTAKLEVLLRKNDSFISSFSK